MLPDSQANLNTTMQFLPIEELSMLDPDVFPSEQVQKLEVRQALMKRYVDIKTYADIASNLGQNTSNAKPQRRF